MPEIYLNYIGFLPFYSSVHNGNLINIKIKLYVIFRNIPYQDISEIKLQILNF